MAQVQVHAEASVATRTDTAIAAGLGNHLPIGDYSGADYRSAVRFPVPAGWNAWTALTKATLSFWISDHQHVAPKSSSIYVSRMQVTAPIWSKSPGGQNCESGFTGGNNTQSDDIQSTSADRTSFTSGSTANAAKSVDVTAAMRYYWGNGAGTSKPVFVFDNNGSGQYTELWSAQKTGGYDLILTIDYETNTPPTAPTLSSPAENAVLATRTPTFSWVHNDPQGDPQVDALIKVVESTGPTVYTPFHPAAGSNQSVVCPYTLPPGTYTWQVQTADASGMGPLSGYAHFSIKADPVVTISTNRRMFYNGAPRLAVDWSCDQPQGQFRVSAPGYDTGIRSGGDQSWTLDTLALTNGTPVAVTVQVWNTDGVPLTASAVQSFTPRWGLTTHKRTLAAVPVNWQAPVVAATVPAGAQLVVEYGSAATAGAGAPTAWYSSIASVPKTQFVWYRAWFIPNASAGPTLDSISIGYDSTIAVLDKWGINPVWPWEANGGIPALFSIDTGEAVYGTRSLRLDSDGTVRYVCSTKVKVREGRSYILSGLMRSQGNSKMFFKLQSGSIDQTVSPKVTSASGVLTDWTRYKTPVWKAPADMDVFVVLLVDGTGEAGTCWWDGIKLEESIVATPWNPASVGATVLDAGGVQVDGTKGGLLRYKGTAGGVRDVVEGGTNGLLFGGDAPLSSDTAGVLTVPPLDGFGMYGLRAGQWVTGGGVCTRDVSNNFKWSGRFIVISQGTGPDSASNGYYDINCPTSGTVQGVGSHPNVTATAAGIPVAIWEALYVVLPKGAGSGVITVNDFRIVAYNTMTNFVPPSNWVLLALHNGDDGVLYVVNGLRMLLNQNLSVGGGLDVRGSVVVNGGLGVGTGAVSTGRIDSAGLINAGGGLFDFGQRIVQPNGLLIARGTVTVTFSNSSLSAAITWPYGVTFSSPPIVVCSALAGPHYTASLQAAPTTTGCAVQSRRNDGSSQSTSFPVHCIAIGPQ